MDTVETSALRTMMDICENPDVRQGIQCALDFIEVSGYYNLTDWNAMSEEEQKEDVLNYMKDCPKKKPRIWYFAHNSSLEYAVVIAKSEEEAIEKLKIRRKEIFEKESYFNAQEWNVEEFTEDMYSGVLYFS